MSNHNIAITQADNFYRGIDVSSYQGDINFEQVRDSGIEAVYIKAGEGGGLTDPYFLRNYQNASAANLIFGFYFYVTALNPDQARLQADEFYNLIRDKAYTARPAMDFENFDGLEREDINAIGLAFMEELESLTGVTPMIYSDAYSAETIWDDSFSRFPLWIADYSNRDDFPSSISVWTTWTGYQYSDTGTVPGIMGNVDMNRFRRNIRLTVTETPAPPEETAAIRYLIRPGDTLTSISEEFNVSIDSIASLNGISNPDRIFAGDVLMIPQRSVGAGTILYTIESGDTLWELARRYGTTVPAIASLNRIADPSLIYIGQVLQIPAR